jgi:uncharacterized NAD(P)/FAD-binding protein YdhS
MMKKVAIIGAGFSGTMTAIHLMQNSPVPLQIILINDNENFFKGIAYSSYSKRHLLNVPAGKMSALPDEPAHFVKWLQKQEQFRSETPEELSEKFISRILYGNYLSHLWNTNANSTNAGKHKIETRTQRVKAVRPNKHKVSITYNDAQDDVVDSCVIATGNQLPAHPQTGDPELFKCPDYFQNPWTKECVTNLNEQKPVLILGNGLTMVDTVLSLLEAGFKNEIYSLSPNGFHILPYRRLGINYNKLLEELPDNPDLFELVKLFRKHIKSGIAPELVTDSLRSKTQVIWKKLPDDEKKLFMSRLRHLWGVARHRIPDEVHTEIQGLKISGKLHIKAGRIIEMIRKENFIQVVYSEKKTGKHVVLDVSRLINCTGPQTNFSKLENHFLKAMVEEGTLAQDPLHLGLRANTETYQLKNNAGEVYPHLFSLGCLLRGELWETTAVNEIRVQAQKVAENIIACVMNKL